MILNLEAINLIGFQSINASANAPELVVGIAKLFAVYVLYALPFLSYFFGDAIQKESEHF